MKKIINSILLLLSLVTLTGCKYGILNPKGPISEQQFNLMVICVGLMLIVVVPVIIMAIVFSFKYKKGNNVDQYQPEWGFNKTLEAIVWGGPIAIIIVLAVLTFKTSHSLDPYKSLHQEDGKDEMIIQVVTLDWKWLFIYPDSNIATVNHVVFPEDTPISFRITSDSVMSSFWVPQLSGQIYAMAGMETKMHLLANEAGTYRGLTASYNGDGYGQMEFEAIAKSQEDYDSWVQQAASSGTELTLDDYKKFRMQSKDEPKNVHYPIPENLFGMIIDHYMVPGKQIFESNGAEASGYSGAH